VAANSFYFNKKNKVKRDDPRSGVNNPTCQVRPNTLSLSFVCLISNRVIYILQQLQQQQDKEAASVHEIAISGKN
jgi:hypothetical protein